MFWKPGCTYVNIIYSLLHCKKSLNVKTKAFIISAFRRHTYLYGVLQYHLSKQPSSKTENHTGKLSAAHHWIFQHFSSKTSG